AGDEHVGVRLQPRLAAETRLVRERPRSGREVQTRRKRARRPLAMIAVRIAALDVLPRHAVEAEHPMIDRTARGGTLDRGALDRFGERGQVALVLEPRRDGREGRLSAA